MEKEKIDKTIEAELFSANTNIVVSAINKIKEKGNKLYIPLLFDVLKSEPENTIEKEIELLLGTVKVKETAVLFARALGDKRYNSIRKNILVACWQNGLEFHPYLPVFVDLVINEEWEIAFEAFTVIDNMEFLPEQDIIEKTKQKIDKALLTATDKKEYFLKEILAKLG